MSSLTSGRCFDILHLGSAHAHISFIDNSLKHGTEMQITLFRLML